MPGLDVSAAATRAAVLAGDRSLSATGRCGGTSPPGPERRRPPPIWTTLPGEGGLPREYTDRLIGQPPRMQA